MNLIEAVLAPFQHLRSDSGPRDPRNERYWPRNLFTGISGFGHPTGTGLTIDPYNARSNSVWWACSILVADAIAMLPRELMKKKGDGKVPDYDHPSYEMISIRPNPETTKFNFEQDAYLDLVDFGNHISEVIWTDAGYPVQMWRRDPERFRIIRDKATGQLDYYYREPDGSERHIPRMNIHHRRMPSRDGVIGMSLLSLAAESLSLGISMEDYLARFFKNDASPGGVLIHPEALDTEAKKNIKEQWKLFHQGSKNRHEIAVLDRGVEYKPTAIDPEKAQMIEGRSFQVPEICRFHKVTPHLISHMEAGAGFASVGAKGQDFITYTLNGHLRNIRESMERDFLFLKDKVRNSIEFRVEALLQGDFPEQNTQIATGIQWGIYSPNEGRRLKNLNPVEGGDIRIMPMNYVPFDKIEAMIDAKINSGNKEKTPGNGENAVQNEKNQGEKPEKRAKEALEPLFRDAMSRIVSRETLAVERAVKKYAKNATTQEFGRWADEFYLEQRSFIEKVVAPLVDAASNLAGSMTAAQKAELVTHATDALVIEAQNDLIKAVAGANPYGEVSNLVADWEQTRAGRVTRRELDRVFNRIEVQHEN